MPPGLVETRQASAEGGATEHAEQTQQPDDHGNDDDDIEDGFDVAIHRNVIVNQPQQQPDDNQGDDEIDEHRASPQAAAHGDMPCTFGDNASVAGEFPPWRLQRRGWGVISPGAGTAHAKDPANNSVITAAKVFDVAAGNPERALAKLDTALLIDPQNTTLLNTRCWYRATRRLELDKAMADCEAGLERLPVGSALRTSRGLIGLQTGDYRAAVADFSAALAADPRDADALYGRALARRQLNLAGSEADLARARARNKDIDAEFARYKLPFALPPAPRKTL